MMGRNHLITTAAAIAGLGYPAAAAGRAFAASHDVASGPWAAVQTVGRAIVEAVADGGADAPGAIRELAGALAYAAVVHPLRLDGAWWAAMAVWAVAMALLGSLLPDIDSPNSIAGRRLAAPRLWLGPHRSISHANWAPMALFAAGFLASAIPFAGPLVGAGFYALAWGYLGHLIADGFSRAGRAPWWPLGRWGFGPGGMVVSHSHALGTRWYTVGGLSEYLMVGLFAAAMAVSLAASLNSR
ncbi:MAG: metal-dependent hydrolase [Bifidobacteriaceae bacterium]|jgi:hypothetical protein|nr:metal-dependent hydrolase [Bifidobacteriaceae bacterium]